MNKIYAMLPCYNEEDNIVDLISQWLKMKEPLLDKGYKLTVIAIDDKSTDSTADRIRDCVTKYPNDIRLHQHEVNKNLGGGVTTAFSIFNKECGEGDLCVLMDGDNTHDPKYILSMIDKINEGADVVIASRYQKGAEVVGVPGFREFLSNGAGVYYKLVLNVKNVKDYTCGYRVYKYSIIDKAINKYKDKFVEKQTFACMMEVLYKLYKIGAVFDEVPFTLRYDNKEGASKMRIMKTIKDSLLTSLSLRFKKI
ncbi:MAG: glycosyltransferase [Lachnospiraceae bacterium]|nr:glycosyltransferase [Lachnospiraceae bacterium]